MGLNVCIYENGLQELRNNVCFNFPVIRTGQGYIGKIMAISQVPETFMDIGGACKMGWILC